MEKKKKLTKPKSGSAKLDPIVLADAKKHCKIHGILLTYFITESVKEKLSRAK